MYGNGDSTDASRAAELLVTVWVRRLRAPVFAAFAVSMQTCEDVGLAPARVKCVDALFTLLGSRGALQTSLASKPTEVSSLQHQAESKRASCCCLTELELGEDTRLLLRNSYYGLVALDHWTNTIYRTFGPA